MCSIGVHYRALKSILWEILPHAPATLLAPARVPQLLEALRVADAPPLLRRNAMEQLFGVRRRRAIALLHRCGAEPKRGELVAPRAAVVAFLEHSKNNEAIEQAQAQERSVAHTLAEARRALRLPSIPLPAPDTLAASTFAGLPSGIRLTREQLSIDFANAQDLLEKLFALSQAFANDYENLEAALARGDPEGKGEPHRIAAL